MRTLPITAEALFALEERLLDPRVRRLASEVEKLLADDFCEFGTDGKVTHWLEESILPGNRDSVGLVSWHVRMEL